MIEIGKRIAESRRSAGFTQEELANRLGVTPQALSKWEKGASSPDLEMLTSLCDILEVSADYLVRVVDHPVLKQIYPALIDGIVPQKLSYGLILDVTRGVLKRGNGKKTERGVEFV